MISHLDRPNTSAAGRCMILVPVEFRLAMTGPGGINDYSNCGCHTYTLNYCSWFRGLQQLVIKSSWSQFIQLLTVVVMQHHMQHSRMTVRD